MLLPLDESRSHKDLSAVSTAGCRETTVTSKMGPKNHVYSYKSGEIGSTSRGEKKLQANPFLSFWPFIEVVITLFITIVGRGPPCKSGYRFSPLTSVAVFNPSRHGSIESKVVNPK